jgi:hypothetical protein
MYFESIKKIYSKVVFLRPALNSSGSFVIVVQMFRFYMATMNVIICFLMLAFLGNL